MPKEHNMISRKVALQSLSSSLNPAENVTETAKMVLCVFIKVTPGGARTAPVWGGGVVIIVDLGR